MRHVTQEMPGGLRVHSTRVHLKRGLGNNKKYGKETALVFGRFLVMGAAGFR